MNVFQKLKADWYRKGQDGATSFEEYPPKVRVYRNLHKDCWSVRDFDSKSENYNRVVGRVQEIALEEVKFVVSQAGREKVLKEKRKNVHAFVQGSPRLTVDLSGSLSEAHIKKVVTYNPYEGPKFSFEMDLDTEVSVDGADFAVLKMEEDRAWVEAYWVDVYSFIKSTCHPKFSRNSLLTYLT